MDISIVYISQDDGDPLDPDSGGGAKSSGGQKNRPELKSQRSVSSLGSDSSLNSNDDRLNYLPVKIKGGPQKRPAGYQAELVCLTIWQSVQSPEAVTALALNSAYGL